MENYSEKLEASMERLERSGKRIVDARDDEAGMSISTYLANGEKPKTLTQEEKRLRAQENARLYEQQEAERQQYLIDHPPLRTQLERLLTLIDTLDKTPNEETLGLMKTIVNQALQDHGDYEDSMEYW